jgi:hypothetical protein
MRLEEPHRAYNYHDTIFKAIARCDMNIVYFRWDVDGNGTWDTLKHRTPVKTGNWYRDDKYNLGGIQTLPYVDPSLYGTKTFYARIEVSEDVDDYGNPVNGSIYGVYPVKVITTVPPLSNANNTSNYNLLAMRIISEDDALWYLHTKLTRVGSNNNQIIGYFQSGAEQTVDETLAASCICLR